MSKYRKRFILKMLSFISLVLIALGFLLGQSFKDFYINNEKEKLVDETSLVESILRERTVPDMAAYVDKMYAESNFDMILFNGRGEIIAGTPIDVTKLNVRAINFSAIPNDGTFESKVDETSLQYTKPVLTADGGSLYQFHPLYKRFKYDLFTDLDRHHFIAVDIVLYHFLCCLQFDKAFPASDCGSNRSLTRIVTWELQIPGL
ncbi:hypothetical protein [Exiguobacterium artemiae]